MQRALEQLSRRDLGPAARETVNSLAFAGREAWQDEMRKSLTLRNRFTERRALVEMARSTSFGRGIAATLGHTEEYMALLESGGTERAEKRFRPIPTEVAAGQSFGSLRSGRTRAVRPSAIITRLGSKHRSRSKNNARAIRDAIRTGKRLVLLVMGRRRGIYRVKGSKRKPKLVKLYDLSRRRTPVPRTPTLERAVWRAHAQGPAIAHYALGKAIDRMRGD